MNTLKMLVVLIAALVLASCEEFLMEPTSTENTDATTAKTAVRETGAIGVSEFHAKVVGPDSVQFSWKVSGRYDGLYLRRANMNYVAVYPLPFPVITDPTVTSLVVGGFVPGTSIGPWELVPYVDGSAADGRIFMKGATLHPKEAATQTPEPGTPSDAWAEALGGGEVRYSWKRNPPYLEDGFELYDNDRQIMVTVPKGATSYTLSGLTPKTIVPGGNDKNTMRLRAFIVLEDGSRWYAPELLGFPWVLVR